MKELFFANLVANVFLVTAPVIVVFLIVFTGIALLLKKCLITTNGDEAILRSGQGGVQVSFDHAICIPQLHSYVKIPLTIQTLSYHRTDEWALRFRCGTDVELMAELLVRICLLYTSPSPRDGLLSRMPSSA